VELNAETVAGHTASFSIDAAVHLTGTLRASPKLVLGGNAVQADYAVLNSGNTAAGQTTLSLLVINPQTQEILHTDSQIVNLNLNEPLTGQFVLSTTGFGLKTYTLLLQSEHQQTVKTLATDSFTVKDGLPPVVFILAPADGSLQDAEVILHVSATDDVSGVDRVQYRIDTGAWRPLPPFGENTNKYGTTWNPVEEDEGAHTIYFRASDIVGNVSNCRRIDAAH
jgi:hypothetical protein